MTHSDQLGNNISLDSLPRRIISLVPSQTEFLFDLGLEKEIVGVTKFCIHPSHLIKEKTIVGGTKNFHFDVIDQLKPDLIIGNKEENDKDGIEILRKKFPMWMSDITTLKDAFGMMKALGEMTNRESKADAIAERIRLNFQTLGKRSSKKVLYLIWRKPWMGAASETFIDTMLNEMGFENILKERSRYPELSEEEIKSLNPDIIFLSSEPYPFKEKHIEELQSFFPHAKVMLVDGEMFSWYGSRLIKAPAYFNQLNVESGVST